MHVPDQLLHVEVKTGLKKGSHRMFKHGMEIVESSEENRFS